MWYGIGEYYNGKVKDNSEGRSVWIELMCELEDRVVDDGYLEFNMIYRTRENTTYSTSHTLDGLKPYIKKIYDDGNLYTGGLCFDHHWRNVYEQYVDDHEENKVFVIYVEEEKFVDKAIQLITSLTAENLCDLNYRVELLKKEKEEEDYEMTEEEGEKWNAHVGRVEAKRRWEKEQIRLKEEEEDRLLKKEEEEDKLICAKLLKEAEEKKLEEARRKLQMNKPTKQELTKQANKSQQNKKKEKEAFEKEVREKAKIIEQIERDKALKKKLQKQKKEKEKRQREEIPESMRIVAYNRILELDLEEIENIVYCPAVF